MPKRLTEEQKAIRAFNKEQRKNRIKAKQVGIHRCSCGSYLSLDAIDLREELCRSCQRKEADLASYKILEAAWYNRTC